MVACCAYDWRVRKTRDGSQAMFAEISENILEFNNIGVPDKI